MIDEVGAGFDDHAFAQARAELDLAALLVTEHVFDQKGNATERSVAECALVEFLDAIGIGFDDGVDFRIDGGDGAGGSFREFFRGDFLLGDQRGRPSAS